MTRSTWLLLAVVVVDQLDSGMATPIYPMLLTEPGSGSLLVSGRTAESAGVWLVALMGLAYAVPAFLFQPLLGQLSDRFGRKPLLLASFASSTLAYGVFAAAVWLDSLGGVLLARVVDGVAAGNILVAAGVVADRSDGSGRTRGFGLFTAALSVGFVLGPLAGGHLSDTTAAGWRGPGTAFAVAGTLNAVAMMAFWFGFRESLAAENRQTEAFAWGKAFTDARDALTDERRRPIYGLLGCFIFAYTALLLFYNVLLAERFDLGPVGLGWFFAALGLGFTGVQVFLVDPVERWLGPRTTLCGVFFLMGGSILLMAGAWAPWVAFVALAPFALGAGLIEPLLQSLLSRSATGAEQGRVQGVRGSVDSLARVLPPLAAGPIAALGATRWAVVAAAVAAVAGGVLAVWLRVGDAAPEAIEEVAAPGVKRRGGEASGETSA